MSDVCTAYLQVLGTKVAFCTPKLLAAMHGNTFSYLTGEDMIVHYTMHLFASGRKYTHSVAFGNTCYAKNCFSNLISYMQQS